jgi:sugar phosphate permease
VLKLLTVWLKPQYFAFASGMVVVVGMLGGMFGDIGLSVLMRFEGWRLTCYWVAILGVIIALILCVALRDNPKHQPSLEKVSIERFVVECLRLLRNKQIWLNGLIGCLLYLPILGFAETWQIPYLAYVMDYQHVDAALAAATVFCGCAVAAPIVGWISDTIKQRRLPLTMGAVIATILMTCVLYMPDISKHMMYVLLFFYGMATSVYILTFAISRDLSTPALSATAFAITNMLVALSGVSVILIGLIIESAWQSAKTIGLHSYGVSAFQIAFMIFPVALILAVLLTFFLEETYCRRRPVIEVEEDLD